MKKHRTTSPFLTLEDFSQFIITRKIAEGGMGTVYEAQQIGAGGFEKTVAIKTMLETLAKQKFSQMFIEEAKLAANLVHENIVQIYHLGQMPGGYYIVMEYVNGISLSHFISYHKTMKIKIPKMLAVFIAGRIARGMAYAHKRSDPTGKPLDIVHRDICPSNILITTEGSPKLADFGVAKVAKNAFIGDRHLVGTLSYMAPEQAKKENVDHRADIFSLGAVLFEMLSLHSIRDVKLDIHARTIAAQKMPWKYLPASISKELWCILHKMLALDPKDRYQDTDILTDALEYYHNGRHNSPTTRTLERYLRQHFSFLHELQNRNTIKSRKEEPTVIPSPKFFKWRRTGKQPQGAKI